MRHLPTATTAPSLKLTRRLVGGAVLLGTLSELVDLGLVTNVFHVAQNADRLAAYFIVGALSAIPIYLPAPAEYASLRQAVPKAQARIFGRGVAAGMFSFFATITLAKMLAEANGFVAFSLANLAPIGLFLFDVLRRKQDPRVGLINVLTFTLALVLFATVGFDDRSMPLSWAFFLGLVLIRNSCSMAAELLENNLDGEPQPAHSTNITQSSPRFAGVFTSVRVLTLASFGLSAIAGWALWNDRVASVLSILADPGLLISSVALFLPMHLCHRSAMKRRIEIRTLLSNSATSMACSLPLFLAPLVAAMVEHLAPGTLPTAQFHSLTALATLLVIVATTTLPERGVDVTAAPSRQA